MINTTQIDAWTGPIQEVGPMYPFPGLEWLMVVLSVAFWLFWIVWQWRYESNIYKRDMEEWGDTLLDVQDRQGRSLLPEQDGHPQGMTVPDPSPQHA